MIMQLTAGPKAWVSTLLLAGMGLLANNALGQSPHSLVDSDAGQVTLDDQMGDYVDLDSDVEQVGFFDAGHAGSCDGCGNAPISCCCCSPWWAHRTGMFGEVLFLRPGNADQIYTIEQNDVVPGAFPTGQTGRVNIDEELGYRVGLSWCASECTSLVASWTRWEGNSQHATDPTGANVLSSQIIHPSGETTGTAGLQSGAALSIDFDLVDVNYRHIWKSSDIYAINWLAGFRYGEMSQDLQTQQELSVADGGLHSHDIDVDMDGFGITIGVDAERRSPCSGLSVYSKYSASFLTSFWEGSYVETEQFGGGVVANNYDDVRITPILELELGFGWQSDCGKWRATTGYMTSAWYDAVSTREYIEGVRANSYVSITETITFSGLIARLEGRF